MSLVNNILFFILQKFIYFCVFVKKYNLPIFLFMILFLLISLIIIENQLQLKRKTFASIVMFAISLVVATISFFIVVPTISFIINISIIIVWLSIIRSNKNFNQVISAIYSSDLVFEEEIKGPSNFQRLWHGEKEAFEKASNNIKPASPIKSGINFKNIVWSYKCLPIFPHYFKWIMSATTNKEQFYRVQSQLNKYFIDYNWIGSRKDKYFILMAYPKNSKNKVLKFDKKLSDALPWYIVPLGVMDENSMPGSLYFWKIHDSENDLKKYPILNECILWNETPKCPMSLIAGGTGGGKSVLLKTIIAHFINKHNVKLYLSDPKGGAEFANLKKLKEVEYVAINLHESYEIFKEFLLQMSQRYNAMGKLGINELPLNGKVNCEGFVSANNTIFNENEKVHIKFDGKEEDIYAISLQPGMDIVIPENKDFRIPAHWISLTEKNLQIGGIINFKPMIFISDEYAQLIEGNDSPENFKMIEEIKRAVESISRLGRAANIHLIIASQSASNSLFPQTLKNNLHFRSVCGSVTQDISRMIIGTEEAENIPTDPIGTYLGYAKGNTFLYRGFFTTSQNIINLSENKNYQHNNKVIKFDIYNNGISDLKENPRNIKINKKLKLNRSKIDKNEYNSKKKEDCPFNIVQ